MPRKTIQEKEMEAIMRRNLNAMGETVIKETKKITRVLSGDLRKSVNFRVKKFDTLELTQNWYGSDIYPSKKDSGEKNALKITIKKEVPLGTKVMMKEMRDLLVSPFTTKKR